MALQILFLHLFLVKPPDKMHSAECSCLLHQLQNILPVGFQLQSALQAV